MKAATLKMHHKYVIEDVEKPKIEPNDLLVGMTASVICGSEYQIFEGKPTALITISRKPRPSPQEEWKRITVFSYPCAPGAWGHEGVGEVVEVGGKVKDFSVGDVVAGMFYNAHAEYARPWHTKCIVKVPQGLHYKLAAMVGTITETLYAIRVARVKPSDVVVITGQGPVGLLLLQHAKRLGAKMVIVSDPIDYRLEMAKKLGAASVVNPLKEDLVRRILSETNGKGADIVIETSGIPEPEKQALEIASVYGRIIIYGRPKQALNNYIIEYFFQKDIEMVGVAFPGQPRFSFNVSHELFEDSLNLLVNREIDVSSLITHEFPLEKINEAFETATKKQQKVLKVLIKIR